MLGINTKPSLYRDFALLSVLIVMILFIVAIWVSYETYQDHAEKIIKQLENEAVRIDRTLIIEIERASYLVESLGRQIFYDGTSKKDKISNLFNSFDKSANPKNSEFFWVNKNQEIVLSSRGGFTEKPIDVSDRDYMKKSITAPWQIHIGQPILGRTSEKWTMPIGMGISDDDGNFLGAVVITLDINSFSREINNVIKQDGISFAVTNQAFTLLTEQDRSKDFFTKTFNISRLATLDFQKDYGGVYSRGDLFNPDKVFAYYERSSQYPYIIFVGYDGTTSINTIRTILLPRLFQIIVIALFLLSILWMVRKRIIQPVISLTESTASIVRGKGFQPISDNGPAEIEQLAFEIRRMGEYIVERKRIEAELQQKNSVLLKIRESAKITNDIKAQFFEQVGQALIQPASTIREYAESLKNELFGPIGSVKYSEISQDIFRSSQDMLDMLQDVLAISKAETGLLALNDSAVDIPFIIQKCIRLMHERTRFSGIDVIQDIPAELPKLMADELRLKQLLLNVMMGAASQLEANDVIRIDANTNHEQFTIRIGYRPRGAENNPATIQRAVHFSADLSRNGRSDSSAQSTKGLGLALSQLIIAMHGGSLDMKTATDGSVTISLIFPLIRIVEAHG